MKATTSQHDPNRANWNKPYISRQASSSGPARHC